MKTQVLLFFSRSSAKDGRKLLCLLFLLLNSTLFAQVSTGYTFSYATTPGHVALAGATVLGSTSVNDANYVVPIGFTFNFNGVDYTQVGINSNGFLYFGSTTPAINEYTPISSASAMTGVIAGFAGNMSGRQASSRLQYLTSGTCPNRIFTVEWLNVKGGGGSSRLDLQIRLSENTNIIDLHPYDQPYLVSDVINGQMGIRGTSNADYLNRMVSCAGGGSWNPTNPGVANTSTCEINGSACVNMYPPNTSRYRYTPITTVTTATWTGATSTDWFTASNWSAGVVPNSYNHINLPSGMPNYPALTGSTNIYCRNMTIANGASLTSAVGYTATLTISGNLSNSGTITNNGSNYMVLNGATGSTLSGGGSFLAADLSLSGPCANYTMGNSITLRRLAINANSTLSMNTFNLTVYTVLNQVGTINQSTGTLQIEDALPTLTDATFNENTGTTYFAIGTNTPAGNQTIPSITYYNLRVNTNNGFTASIGNGSTVTCNNLILANPGPSGGIASGVNLITVNANFDMAPTGNTLSFNLNNNVNVAGIMTLYKGIISTGVNRVGISNSAAAAVMAGAGNTNYTVSYINGNLRRSIASAVTANYDFPLGDATTSRYAVLMDNALSGGGFTLLDAYFGALANHTDASMIATEPSEAGVTYDHIATEGVWFLDPDNQPAAGTYDIRAYINGISGLTDDLFAILKRPSGSLTGADWDNGGVSATRPASMLPGRTIASGYALRYGLSTFSQFGIANQATIILPIELLTFTGKNMGPKNLLEWSTSSETNNDYFTLEHSADAFAFSEIARVEGAGSSSHLLQYASYDLNPFSARTYYRLKQTDFDGNFNYSNIISIEEKNTAFEIAGICLLTENTIGITVSCSEGCLLDIELYDMTGRKVLSSLENVPGEQNRIIISTGNLSPGIYLVSAFNGKQILTKKIKL